MSDQGSVSVWLERTLARALPGAVLFMLFGLVCTLGALDARPLFSYDDNWTTTHNPLVVHGLGYFWTQLALPFRPAGEAGFATAHWSPLAFLSTALDHRIFGKPGHAPDDFAGWALHAMNGFFHGLCAWLLLRFALRLTRRFEVALGAALIFLFHPVQCESVCWIIERNNILPALFGLWALYVYTGADAEYWTWDDPAAPARASGTEEGFLEPSWARTAAAFALLLCSQLCKASGVSWWPVMVACDLLLMPRASWGRRAARWALLFLPVALSLYVTTKSHPDAVAAPLWHVPLSGWLASAYLYVRYLGLLVCPAPLSAFYYLPMDGPPWAVILGGWAAILGAGVGAWKLGVPGRRVLLYGIWFAAALAPLINPFVTTAYLLQDRYLYPALPAFALFVLDTLLALWNRVRLARETLLIPAAVLAVLLAALAVNRSFVWQSEAQLFADAARTQPKTAFGHLYLASYLFHSSADEQDPEARRALRLTSLKAHRAALACDDYDRLPWSLNYRNECGSLLLSFGRRDEARAVFQEVWDHPGERVHERGARVYAVKFLASDALSAGRFDEGLKFLEAGLARAPSDPDLLRYRLQAWTDAGQLDKARAEAERLRDDPVLGAFARKLLDERLSSGKLPPAKPAP